MKTIRQSDSLQSVYLEPKQKMRSEWHNKKIFVTIPTTDHTHCKKCAFQDRSFVSNRNICARVQCALYQRAKTSFDLLLDPKFKETAVFFQELQKVSQ